MKKRFKLLPRAIVMLVVLLGLFGCTQTNQDRYQDPPWLGGSSIETLEQRGDYTIFLKLMEMANYKEPISKQLFTLFVPNDAAFKTYFQQNGISNVESLTEDQAVQLFTLHVLRNPRSRFQLIYEYLWSELQGPDGEYAALFFRKPTPSTAIPYNETVKYWPAKKGQTLLMYSGEKLVPLFSKDYFEDFFGAVDGSDYKFMYPNSNWEEGHGNMNWGNAMVTESEVRTSSGFIYFIDQVVPPMPNIDQYLSQNPEKYSLYYDILQRFATYATTKTDKQQRVQYLKSYDLVSDLNEERGAFTGNETRMKDMYTAFIPPNDVLQAYLDRTVFKYYSSIDSVPRITLFYILQTQLSRSLGLMSKIEKSYFNSFGDPMTISRSDVKSSVMCSNGALYEMNKVLEPNVFTTVPGNLFFDKNYSTFLFALNQASAIAGLSNRNQDVTLFAPSNAQMEAYHIRYNSISAIIEYQGQDKQWKAMRATDLTTFVQDHIYEGKLDNLSTDQYVEMSSGNFIHIANNEIQAGENMLIRDKVTVKETIPNQYNGILYNVNNVIKSKYVLGKFLVRNKDCSKFTKLLTDTKMLDTRFLDQITRDTIPNLKFLAESDYWTAFIPTNEAMDAAAANGEIPTEAEALKKFILYHFIKRYVIFDDGKLSGNFFTNRVDEVTTEGVKYSPLKITNEINNLTIQDNSGQIVQVAHNQADYLVTKGVAHKINKVLKY